MKYFYNILFLLFIPFIINGQDEQKKEYDFSIGIVFSPDYVTTTIVSKKNNNFHKIGFTSGINFNIDISQRLAINTSILYTDKGYNLKRTLTSYTSYRYIYYKVPMIIQYYIINNFKTDIFILSGISVNLFSHYQEIEVNKINFFNRSKYNNYECYDCEKNNYEVILGMGSSYLLSKSIELFIAPVFNYSFKTIGNRYYLYTISCTTGINYKLNN